MAKVNPKSPTPAKPAKPDAVPKGGGKPEFGKVNDPNDKVYPFKEATPEGYEFGKFKPLKKRDFVEDWLYYEHRAQEMEAKAKAFHEQADESKKLGSGKQRAKAKRLVKLRTQIAELTQALKDQGIDVEQLLADQRDAAA